MKMSENEKPDDSFDDYLVEMNASVAVSSMLGGLRMVLAEPAVLAETGIEVLEMVEDMRLDKEPQHIVDMRALAVLFKIITDLEDNKVGEYMRETSKYIEAISAIDKLSDKDVSDSDGKEDEEEPEDDGDETDKAE